MPVIDYRRVAHLIGTTQEWAANPNIILKKGEIGFEIASDGRIIERIGDGLSVFPDLPNPYADAPLTLTGPAILGREGTTPGPPVPLSLGSGLSIVGGALTATGATSLSYNPTTRLLSSSTGEGVTLPLVTTTAAGLIPHTWLTGAEAAILPHIHGALAGPVYEHVRNVSGAVMPALTPYHVVNSQGDTDIVEIVPADASDPQTMPASGITMTALAASGTAATGHGAIAGVPTGVNTAGNSSGTVLYVGSGVLTPTPPAANVQALAIVGRSHATTGTLAMLSGPALARVAFSGDYNHLANRPTLGTAAALNVGTTAGTVAAGDDSRFSDAREWTAATVDQVEAEAGAATTRRAWTAQRVRQAVAGWWTDASTAAGRALVTAADAAAQRTSLGLGDSATRNVGAAAGTVAAGDDNRFIALSSTAPSNLAATAAAGTGTQAARSDHVHQFQPADVVIPLSGETQSLATGIVVTISRWPRNHVLTAIPLWMVNAASVGAALQFDIRVGGASIFATLPTIDATEQGSDTAAVFAVFSTAFISAGQLIPQNSVVTFHVLQIGIAPSPGAGLKVALPVRRAD